MNRDHSVVFEIASKHCISDSFVDHYGYSISSEGFLSAVVDIMVKDDQRGIDTLYVIFFYVKIFAYLIIDHVDIVQ